MMLDGNSLKRVVISDVDQSWTRDEIEWWLYETVAPYFDYPIPAQIVNKLLPTLDTLKQRYQDYQEDVRADQMLGQWKSEGRSS